MIKLGRLTTTPGFGWRPGWLVAIAVTLVATAAWPGIVSAAETDQFLTWGVELADGSEQLNLFVNQEFERALARLNRKGKERPCAKVPGRLYYGAFSSLLSSRVRRFIEASDIEWYPDTDQWEYRAQSVFRHSVFSFWLPMDRTVRIGEVYLGVDKLAHMFGIGRRYYVRYQRLRQRGLASEEAQRQTIAWGSGRERFFLGGYTEGIISHADLEANFQGLRLAREMCEGADPYLVRDDAGWRFARPVDLRDYINPGFDESYNSNQYFSYQWRVVQPILLEQYCPRYASEEVQSRLAIYRAIDPGSLSREIIARRYEEKGLKSQQLFSLDHLCAGERDERDRPGAKPTPQATTERGSERSPGGGQTDGVPGGGQTR